MNKSYKIIILCLVLTGIFSAACGSAEEFVQSPVVSGNVMSSSGDLSGIMNSLPDVDEAGNVVNPSSDNLGVIMNSLSGEEINVLSETQTALWQGQSSQVYRFSLTCPGTIRMTSSYGARFALYAKKSSGSYCPTGYSIRTNYDKVMYGTGGTTYMYLDPGLWCLMVYGSTGSGSYNLKITAVCPKPTPYPTQTPYPCGLYKTDSREGYLSQGQAAVYGYSIPTDGRSKIEWYMTSTDSSGGSDTPIIIAQAGETSIDSTISSGNSRFDLYLFKDCNPKYSKCATRYHSLGPNAYASISAPSSGSIYYAMVYARSGSGTYHLKMNSYKCSNGDTPIIAASTGDETMMTTMTEAVTADEEKYIVDTEITPPEAEFIQTDNTE